MTLYKSIYANLIVRHRVEQYYKEGLFYSKCS